ncbi:MAG: potassium-transporting ATPase subunit C, partial [Acidimicrobiia bacterium]
SLIFRNGTLVGSKLLGQDFTGDAYFHPRPSAAGGGYDPTASGASNLGPTNPDLVTAVRNRSVEYRDANGLAPGAPVPVDAVTASASGLDPHISVANARIQARRVATARHLPLARVLDLVNSHTKNRLFGFLGEKTVNVFELNLALDAMK